MTTDSNEHIDDIAEELAMLMQILDGGSLALASAAAEVELVRQTHADAAPRDTYKVIGPALTKVAAAGIATLPAVLAPVPAFAGTPMPPNLMVAMAARPVAPPAHHGVPPALAATGPQFFPFTRPMQSLRDTITPGGGGLAAATSAEPAPQLAMNPRLRSIFSEQRKVSITTKRQLTATVYKVQSGDSLYSIAAETLGSGGRWREIYEANKDKIGSGFLLMPGQRLTVASSKPSAGPAVASAPSAAKAAAKAAENAAKAPTLAAAPNAKPYHVAPGDNLYTIAAKQLGNPTRWKEIVSLNKARLNGRTVIFPNQWLQLPSQV